MIWIPCSGDFSQPRWEVERTALHENVNGRSPLRTVAVAGLHNFHGTFWQRIEKGLAVLLGQNAVVENDHDAAIGFGANQPPHALAKFQDGFRQGKFREGISAARFNCFRRASING
jgi:hypothetical protein